MFVFVASFVFIFAVDEAQAGSNFARLNETSCNTCHVVPPMLNAYGRAFKVFYQMPHTTNDQKAVKEEREINLGSRSQKREWPKEPWPGKISKYPPLGIMASIGSTFDNARSPKVDLDVEEVGLIFGEGVNGFSYFGTVDFGNGEVSVNRMFVRAHPYNSTNFKFGLFEPPADPFSIHTDSLHLSAPLLSTVSTTPRRSNIHAEEQRHENEEEHNANLPSAAMVTLEDNDDHGDGNGHSEEDSAGPDFLSAGHHSASGLGASVLGAGVYGRHEFKTKRNFGFGYDVGFSRPNESMVGHDGYSMSMVMDPGGKAFFKYGGLGVLGRPDKQAESARTVGFDRTWSVTVGVFANRSRKPVEFEEIMLDQRIRQYGPFVRFENQRLHIKAAYMKGKDKFLGGGHGVFPRVSYNATMIDAAFVAINTIIPSVRFDQVHMDGLEEGLRRYTCTVAVPIRPNVIFRFAHSRIPTVSTSENKLHLLFVF